MDTTNLAIDLSLRASSPKIKSNVKCQNDNVSVVRPIPRPPWTIMWYQSLWAVNQHHTQSNPSSGARCVPSQRETLQEIGYQRKSHNPQHNYESQSQPPNGENTRKIANDCVSQIHPVQQKLIFDKNESFCDSKNLISSVPVLDVACCDGPVSFERVSNPNFALTVEHNDSPSNDEIGLKSTNCEPRRHLALKTYLCIYCNQSFKSLFCYQKHKKRHLNPVSVDITATNAATNRCNPKNKAKTKDLNVQFFPCKKCGCKFPSYYFVHKHRKVCH